MRKGLSYQVGKEHNNTSDLLSGGRCVSDHSGKLTDSDIHIFKLRIFLIEFCALTYLWHTEAGRSTLRKIKACSMKDL